MSLKLPKLNLPYLPERVERKEGLVKVWDPLRKKWLQLTPEEWVRQSFMLYMHKDLGYPLGLTRSEYALKLNSTDKRADIVYFDREMKARVIVECKAAHIPLDKEVFEQVSRYFIAQEVDVMILTNGLYHHAFSFEEEKIHFYKEIPKFQELVER